MSSRDKLLRDRENAATRKMQNAVWEDQDTGRSWIWFLAGALIVIGVLVS